jgi:type IV secretory pathway TraG/TraD family ATPase VirD4
MKLHPSTWRLEQLQIRLRIFASQGQFWISRGMVVWLGTAAVLLSLGLSFRADQDSVVAWVVAYYTPFKTVTWHGARYNAHELAMWLSGVVYGGTPDQWLWWAMGLGAVPMLVAWAWVLWWVGKGEATERHIRGAQLYEVADLQSVLTAQGEPGISVAGVQIPRMYERMHAMVCGATRTGKTQTIMQLLVQVQARGDIAVVADPEGEYLQRFYDPARGDIVCNPFDARFPGWHPWAECQTEADLEAQAAGLFPIVPGADAVQEYYRGDARIMYQQIFTEVMERKEAKAIPERITAMSKKVTTNIERGLYSTLRIGCQGFRYIPTSPQPWSVRAWCAEPRGWVFLTWRESEKDAALPFLSLCCDAIARRFLARETYPVQTTWLVVDEMKALTPQLSVAALLERGSKHGIAVVLGFQNLLQLYPLYTKALTLSMLDQPATQLLLGSNNPETQDWCARVVGEHEIERYAEGEVVGPENVRDSVSRMPREKLDKLMLPSEFGMFPNLHGVLKVRGAGAARVTVPYMELPIRQPAFVPRVEEHEDAPAEKKTTAVRLRL